MAKANINQQSSNHNQSGTKVRSIDELLATKRAINQLGRSKATETIKKTSDVVRTNTGKAVRAELQNEDGIKQFLTEDIPAVVRALQSELRTKHQETLASNEFKLVESSVIDADWESIDTDFDMSFETDDWLVLKGEVEVKSLPSSSKDNPFNSDDLPE
jgi:hypothetical protein